MYNDISQEHSFSLTMGCYAYKHAFFPHVCLKNHKRPKYTILFNPELNRAYLRILSRDTLSNKLKFI
jgi:hypothetical protein